jgi:DNA uptake protein ComE-like DNA-binding protein
MKLFSLKPLRDWFGFTRRERRSSFILMIIIAITIAIRFIVPKSKMRVEMINLEISERSDDTIRQKPQSAAKMSYTQKAKRQVPVLIIELNSCDSASLETLPGIGPVLSARIIKYRNLLGGFANIDQLREVYGLTEETFNLIRKRVKADPSMIRRISINSAEYRHLIRLPYFEKSEVVAILKYRELNGRIDKLSDIVENKIITEEKADKVKWYLEF